MYHLQYSGLDIYIYTQLRVYEPMYINSRHIYRRHLQGVYNLADCCIGSEDKKNHHCEACSELFNFFSSALIIKTWHLVTSKVIKTVILLHKLSEEKKTNLFLTFNICSYFTAWDRLAFEWGTVQFVTWALYCIGREITSSQMQ